MPLYCLQGGFSSPLAAAAGRGLHQPSSCTLLLCARISHLLLHAAPLDAAHNHSNLYPNHTTLNLHPHPQPDGEQAPEEGEEAYDEEYYDYQEEEEIDYSRPFPAEVPMDANTKMLSSIPLALYYPAVLALAAAGGFVGSAIGRGVPGE